MTLLQISSFWANFLRLDPRILGNQPTSNTSAHTIYTYAYQYVWFMGTFKRWALKVVGLISLLRKGLLHFRFQIIDQAKYFHAWSVQTQWEQYTTAP